jgi:hypothetical protein
MGLLRLEPWRAPPSFWIGIRTDERDGPTFYNDHVKAKEREARFDFLTIGLQAVLLKTD